MQVQGIYKIDDAAQYVPNVALVTAERANNTRVVIRGIGGGFPDPVFVFGSGMYIDGHYIPSSLGGYMSTVDVERIELLRGPQGTLFGKNVIGGLVNIISTKPHDEFDASITAHLGEDGDQSVRAMINVPFSDTFFGRFSAASETFDGYYHNRYLNIDSGGTDNKSGRAAFRWVPNEHWTMDASAARSRKRDDNQGGQCLGDPNGDAPKWGGGAGNVERRLYTGALADLKAICAADHAAGDFVNSSDKHTFSDVDEDIVMLAAAWDSKGAIGPLQNLTITARGSYRNMEYRYLADRDYIYWPLDGIGTLGEHGQSNETYGYELLFEADASDKLKFTLGANYFSEVGLNGHNVCYPMFVNSPAATDPNQSITCPNIGLFFELVPDNYNGTGLWPDGPRKNAGGPGPFLSEVSVWNKSFGVFGHVTYDFTPHWTLDLGGRYTSDDREFHNMEFAVEGCDLTYNPGGLCNFTAPLNLGIIADSGFYNHAAKTFKKFTPMASITRNLEPGGALSQGMFYLLYSEGFLTGGFNTELNSNLPGTAPLLTYDPEEVKNYELGFKGQFLDNKVQLMADVFYMDYKNQQKQITLANPDGKYGADDPVQLVQNIASSKIYGLELEFRASLWEGGFISADVGYLKNEYDTYSFPDPENPGQIKDLSNLLIDDFTPDWTVNLSLEQAFTLSNGATITPRVNMYWQTGYEWATNTGAWYKGMPHSTCYQDPYAKFDGRITFTPAQGDWHIAVYGGNLTDQRILDWCSATRNVWTTRLQRPRNFGVEFSMHFGNK